LIWHDPEYDAEVSEDHHRSWTGRHGLCQDPREDEMRKAMFKAAVWCLVLAALAVFSACSMKPSKVTQENYDQLKIGMKLEQVVAIMGPPKHSSPKFGIEQFTWADGDRHIHAKFAAGRAVYYSCKNLNTQAAGPAVRQPAARN